MTLHSRTVASFNMQTAFAAAPGRLLRGLGVGQAGARARCTVRPMMSAVGVDSTVRAAIKENNVMVFSTTWCPYCAEVKGLFGHLGVAHTVWELDERADGDEIRDFLLTETGQSSVPNIFIKEQHVGGCSETIDLYQDGKLLDMIGTTAK